MCAREELNLQPAVPKTDALSIKLRAQTWFIVSHFLPVGQGKKRLVDIGSAFLDKFAPFLNNVNDEGKRRFNQKIKQEGNDVVLFPCFC